MDEASIQNLRVDLTEDYQSLAKSHTAAIEQMREDFNDDQMLFRLEAEALERPQSRRKNPLVRRSRHRRNLPQLTDLPRTPTRYKIHSKKRSAPSTPHHHQKNRPHLRQTPDRI